MMRKRKRDRKGEGKGEARGGGLLNSQDHVQDSPIGNRMNSVQETEDILRRAKAVGNRKGLPCTVTPEEVELER